MSNSHTLWALVVDDDPSNREVAAVILKSDGHQVSEAVDGVQAIELLELGNRYDVILMDLLMPRLNGIEATKRIRDNPECAKIPIIAVTGSARDALESNEPLRLFDEIIHKPYRRRELLAALVEVLGDRATIRLKGPE